MDNFFIRTYYLIKKRKAAFFILFALLFGAGIYTISHITFEEDITQILPSGEKSNEVAKVLGQLNFSDKITVMIKAKNEQGKAELANISHIFLEKIKPDSIYYTEIQGKVDNQQIEQTYSFVYDHLPLFLEAGDYTIIEEKLSKDSIDAKMQGNYNSLISPSGIVTRNFILKDPLSLAFLGLTKLQNLGVSQDFILKDGFVTTADSTVLLLFITPTFSGTDSKSNEPFVKHLYEYQKEINLAHEAHAELSYFGSPFIALANAEQIQSDIKSTVVISVTVLMIILMLFYKKLYIPVILFIPALCGIVVALSVLYFIHPSISAISISVGAILLSITLDYALHVITHYREHTQVEDLYKNITIPLIGCSVTTAIAFLCLLFVQSKVLQDLGIFAAISILSAAFFALLLIPHVYKPNEILKKSSIIDKLGAYNYEKNKFLLGVSLIMIVLGIFSFSKVEFNSNLSDLNYVPENMIQSEKQLEEIGSIGAKSIYLTTYGNNLEQILAKNTKLEKQLRTYKNEGIVKDYNSIGSIVLSEEDQLKKIARWVDFWENKKDSTLLYVNQAAARLGFNEGAFSSLNILLDKAFNPIETYDFQSLDAIPMNEFLIEKDDFITLSTIIKVDSLNYNAVVETLEEEQVLIIDRKHLNEQFLGQIRDDFSNLINYSLLLVFFVLLLYYKRLELTILSLIPIVLTGVVTTGLIYIFNLELNIFSTIVTTLILGIGVDFSIFMTSALQKQYTNGKNEISTYRTSIILAVLTTLLSIGALIFAKHPALKSISWVSLIGVTSAMLITFTFYPLLFKLFISSRSKKGKAPSTIRLTFTALLSHLYFSLGGILFSILGIIFSILPFKREKKKHWLRLAIGRYTKSVLYSNYGVKKVVRNPHDEKFEKPAIIIANHSSLLDTLAMGFLPIPYIMLVNDWVYNSPIFGKAIRYVEYYPTTSGIINGEEELVNTIKKGNSLIVFPEGTRSTTGSIGRFHKGAFLLAQKYNIDILPIYIHGSSNLLPKGDFIIFDGTFTIEIGERISLSETQRKQDTKKITNSISRIYKNWFQEIRYELEDEDYFKQKVKLDFYYKSSAIYSKAMNEFELNKAVYHQLNIHIKDRQSILRLGNDLGIWDMMLVLQKGRRKVYSYIENEEYRNIAKQSYLVNSRNLVYLDHPLERKASHLLITDQVNGDIIIQILDQNSFKSIILISNSVNPEFFDKFDYKLKVKNEHFFIFTND